MTVDHAVRLLRAALDEHGLIMLHDAVLPSATSIVAGEPVKGSWWGHSAGHAIFHAVSAIEDEVLSVKLVAGKVTLVASPLWAAVAAVGAAKEAWQTRGLGPGGRTLLERIERDGSVMTTDLEAAEKKAAKDLEKRLLVLSREVHTASGAHASRLGSWADFGRAQRLATPDPVAARHAIEQAVAAWPAGAALPWRSSK